jgi:hypothetical protein
MIDRYARAGVAVTVVGALVAGLMWMLPRGRGLPGDRPKRLRVPSVPPGEYRIAGRVSVQRGTGAPLQGTVYGRLRVTG